MSSRSAGPKVLVPCCDVPVPTTLTATVGGTCAGSRALTFSSVGGLIWSHTGQMGVCGLLVPEVIFNLVCNTPSNLWTLTVARNITQYSPASVSCDPIHLVFNNVDMSACGCGTVTVEITA